MTLILTQDQLEIYEEKQSDNARDDFYLKQIRFWIDEYEMTNTEAALMELCFHFNKK